MCFPFSKVFLKDLSETSPNEATKEHSFKHHRSTPCILTYSYFKLLQGVICSILTEAFYITAARDSFKTAFFTFADSQSSSPVILPCNLLKIILHIGSAELSFNLFYIPCFPVIYVPCDRIINLTKLSVSIISIVTSDTPMADTNFTHWSRSTLP